MATPRLHRRRPRVSPSSLRMHTNHQTLTKSPPPMPSPLLFFAALHRYHNCCSRPGCCGALAIGVLHRALLVVAIHPHRDASNVKRGFGALPKPSLLKRGGWRGEERGELKEMSQETERNDKETPCVRKRCRKEKRNLLVRESSLLGFFPETKT